MVCGIGIQTGITYSITGDSVPLFGLPGWSPVVGDWNADGTTDIGVANGQLWYLDMNNNGIWDAGDRSIISDYPAGLR